MHLPPRPCRSAVYRLTEVMVHFSAFLLPGSATAPSFLAISLPFSRIWKQYHCWFQRIFLHRIGWWIEFPEPNFLGFNVSRLFGSVSGYSFPSVQLFCRNIAQNTGNYAVLSSGSTHIRNFRHVSRQQSPLPRHGLPSTRVDPLQAYITWLTGHFRYYHRHHKFIAENMRKTINTVIKCKWNKSKANGLC